MSNIAQNLFSDLKIQRKTDCTFQFAIFSVEKTLKAHKNVLAQASPVFDAMFYGSMKETSTVKVEDVSYETFWKLLE